MEDSDNGEDLTIGLEILPGGGRSTTGDEAEAEGASGVPWLVREGRFLVLSVEGADGGEIDLGLRGEEGGVVAEERTRDAADREDGDSDRAHRLDADVRLHGCRRSRNLAVPSAGEGRVWETNGGFRTYLAPLGNLMY